MYNGGKAPAKMCIRDRYCWPSNRRILYNRASADLAGKPWNPEKKLVEWTGEKWDQVDVADFVTAKNGTPVPPNNKAFFMLWEQNARLISYGMNDGPVPEHYEPCLLYTSRGLHPHQR